MLKKKTRIKTVQKSRKNRNENIKKIKKRII